MVYRGHIRNGTIVFDDSVALPEGAEVDVSVRCASAASSAEAQPSLYERMMPFIGVIDDLPSDYSCQHDHYLYGMPKHK